MDKTTASYPRGRVFSDAHEFRPAKSKIRWHYVDSPEPAHTGPQPPQKKDRQRGTTLFEQINAIRKAQHPTVPIHTQSNRAPKRLQRVPQASVTASFVSHHGPNQPHASGQAGKFQVAISSPPTVSRYGSRLPVESPHMIQRSTHNTIAHTYSTNNSSSSRPSTNSHHVRLPKECNPYYRKMSNTPSRLETPEYGDVHRDRGPQSRYTPHYSNFEDARELIGRRGLPSTIPDCSLTSSTSTCSSSNRPTVTHLAPPRSISPATAVAPIERKFISVSPDTKLAGPSSDTYARDSSVKRSSLSRAGKRVVALDCEMIGCLEVNTPRGLSSGLRGTRTKKGKKRKAMFREISVAARCSIVDYSGRVLYDGYIMPKLKILNLRTRYSGITRKHLETAVPFDTAQAEIANLLEGCVVVGHALQNDTAALNITLPQQCIRDTSMYRPLREMAGLDPGQMPSLKNLAKALLGVQIQKGSHCSLEDARTTLELYKLVEQAWECIS